MRYLATFIDVRFLLVFPQNTWNFASKIWVMIEKMKTDVNYFWFKKYKKVQFQ